MPTEKSVLAKTSKSSLNTVADVITIEAGHLNGSLYLPDALQPNNNKQHNRLRINITAVDTDDENPCCLIGA